MSNRYENRRVVINNHKLYRKVLEGKGVNFVKQFTSEEMPKLTAEEIQLLDLVPHTWTLGDRFYKLAYTFYGDQSMWWIIAWFNQRPTDYHVSVGEAIYIPLPLNKVLSLMN